MVYDSYNYVVKAMKLIPMLPFCVSYHDSRVDAQFAKRVSFRHLDDLRAQLRCSMGM